MIMVAALLDSDPLAALVITLGSFLVAIWAVYRIE